MLIKPSNYDEIEVIEYGDFEPLKLGGHKCIIVNVEEYEGMTGNRSLKVDVDIDKGDEQEGYYKKQYENNSNSDKKWPAGATRYVSLRDDETCVRMLKAFITAVENSNPNYKYDWNKDVKQLIGKKLAGNWGLEEYTDSDGKTKVATKIREFRSLDKLESLKIPRVKLLNGSLVNFLDYESNRDNSTSAVSSVESTESVSVGTTSEDEMPFDL